MKDMHKCIHCGVDAPATWFCSSCTAKKELSYKVCETLNITDYTTILIIRDAFIAHGDDFWQYMKTVISESK